MKKEKPLIQHPIDAQPTISEIPLAQALVDERCMNLSEKEVMDLFEKMMVRRHAKLFYENFMLFM